MFPITTVIVRPTKNFVYPGEGFFSQNFAEEPVAAPKLRYST
jgi:hypothetical protein